MYNKLNFLNEYSNIFSEADLIIDNTRLCPIVKNSGKELVISELHLKYLNLKCEDIPIFSKNAFDFYHTDLIHYYTFPQKDIKYFDKNYSFYKLFNSYCDTKKFNVKSQTLRNINKSIYNPSLKYIPDYNYDLLHESLNLIKYADYFKNYKHMEQQHIDLYLKYKDDAVVSIVKHDDAVCGIMIGFIFMETLFMIEHLYNPQFNKYYINDGLYYNFILNAIDKNIRIINFGTVEVNDLGLLRMKKKYSTLIESSYIISYRKNF